MNMFVGILIGAIMCLGVYYTNAWNTGYMPINSNYAFDNTGVPFNVSVSRSREHKAGTNISASSTPTATSTLTNSSPTLSRG